MYKLTRRATYALNRLHDEALGGEPFQRAASDQAEALLRALDAYNAYLDTCDPAALEPTWWERLPERLYDRHGGPTW